MFHLSVCADTIFLDLPFEERVKKIAEAGFMVEFWGWKGRNLDVFSSDPTIQVCGFTGTQAGSCVHPEGLVDYLAGITETTTVAKKLGATFLVIHAGELGPNGEVVHKISTNPATRWITAYKALSQLAKLGEENDITYTLEVLNTKVDHPCYSINIIEDAVRLVKEVNSPYVKILYDIYHTQVEEGNVVELLQKYHPYIGHVHVADVPGRHEPGTGELNFRFIAQVLRDVGYAGVVGMEAYPLADSYLAMERFRAAFKE
ncbi:MAG: hydroxypyruvate isomerase [Chloroflexi bacterium HGW-Chloroflexi-3]|nr:MAG: hydroxypyruvate isomerase [Chloroflexi bacterium HGW-Chloroflexi-3]